jgi:hypothetical protein
MVLPTQALPKMFYLRKFQEKVITEFLESYHMVWYLVQTPSTKFQNNFICVLTYIFI